MRTNSGRPKVEVRLLGLAETLCAVRHSGAQRRSCRISAPGEAAWHQA